MNEQTKDSKSIPIDHGLSSDPLLDAMCRLHSNLWTCGTPPHTVNAHIQLPTNLPTKSNNPSNLHLTYVKKLCMTE